VLQQSLVEDTTFESHKTPSREKGGKMQSVKSDSEGSAAVVGEAGPEKKQRISYICTPLSSSSDKPSCDSDDDMVVDANPSVAASLKEFGLEESRPSARTYTFPLLSGSGIFDLSGATSYPDLRKKKVTFAHSLETQQASPPLFHDEVLARWYSLDDYLEMRVECMKTVVLIQIGATMLEEDHCKRGLEAHFRQNVSFMKSREDIVDEVLNKQVDLWSEGQGAEHARLLLAKTYSMHSTQHGFKAMVTALHDWKGVLDD
jgi:hypothetical protein